MKKIIFTTIAVILIAIAAFLFFKKGETEKDLKTQIGQMLVVGFRGTNVSQNPEIINDIKNLNLGGVILFDYDVPSKSSPRNITSPEQLIRLTHDLQKEAETPLLIAIDAEGGQVNRLKEKYGFLDIPSAEEMGEQTTEYTRDISNILATELKALGINTNFAPVVDVNINIQNPAIGALSRSFSSDPEKVAEYALSFILGHHEEGIITTIKHFPGHGSSESDSHLGLVDVTQTYNEIEKMPFKALIESGETDMVMTAHIINRNIDPDYPATLSDKFLKGILREELGFNGVIVSDDMQMGAIVENFGFEESIIRAINSGCDLLIFSNNGDSYDPEIAQKAVDVIYKAVSDGRILEQTITDSLERINNLKEKYLN
jgi:beta-N-acetylhexosaminidase